MENNIYEANIYEALRHIQEELKAPKNQYNKFGNYNYRSCEDIFNAVKPLLAKYGCTLVLTDEVVLIGDRYYVKATATLSAEAGILLNPEGVIVKANNVSNTAYAREDATKKGMDSSQVTGSCSSYARKYALNGLFLIDDVKDSDYTNTGDKKYQNAEITEQRYMSFVDNFLFEHPGYQDAFFAKYKLHKVEDLSKLPLETIDIIITGMKKVEADEKEKTSIYGKEETF